MKFISFFDRIQDMFDLRSEMDVEAAMASIRKNSNFHGMNIWILACAIIIASLGLNVNSTAVIIGAMLISPLMGPIIGMGLAVGTNDLSLMRSALKNLGTMVAISIIFSSLFFVLSPLNMQHPSELLARTNPTIYDVLIAFVGGVAGALETSRKEKGTVISGVAIATALMPPLCTVGYGISTLQFHIVAGAFYLFFINCVFVALATMLMVKIMGFPKVSHINPKVAHRAKRITWVMVLAFIIPSIISAVSVIRENNFNTSMEDFVKKVQGNITESVIYDYKTDTQQKPYTITLFIAGKRLSDVDKETIYSAAEREFGLNRHQVLFKVALASGEDSELEKMMYEDMSKNIQQLQSKVKEYESSILPYSQIDMEVTALFPQITSLELARGKDTIFAIVNTKSSGQLDTTGLTEWLKIRLKEDNISLLIK